MYYEAMQQTETVHVTTTQLTLTPVMTLSPPGDLEGAEVRYPLHGI